MRDRARPVCVPHALFRRLLAHARKAKTMTYRLELTDDDMRSIDFVGLRYGWSAALGRLEVGTNDLAEHEAWVLRDACEAGTIGGHSLFPMLDPRSMLADKLNRFLESIV